MTVNHNKKAFNFPVCDNVTSSYKKDTRNKTRLVLN